MTSGVIVEEEVKGAVGEGVTAEKKESEVIEELQAKEKEVDEEQLNMLAAERMKIIVKKMMEERSQRRVEKYEDKVKLGEDGWKLRYYKEKFHIDPADIEEFIGKIRQAYLEGLQWVYSYYYNGCASWTWYYPFHYAPFAGDLVSGKKVEISFDLGTPATPFEQLLGVFPKQSAHAIPVCYRHLLSEPDSEIIDFYPTNFHIDINGQRFEWMGVTLLPFIDRERLVRAMRTADRNGDALNPHEKELNQFGKVMVFMQRDDQS